MAMDLIGLLAHVGVERECIGVVSNLQWRIWNNFSGGGGKIQTQGNLNTIVI